MHSLRPGAAAPRWWFPLVGAGSAALVVAAVVGLAERSGSRPPAAAERRARSRPASDGEVHLAGTGTWLPLARALAAAYSQERPDVSLVVHESIGSRGGRRAVADGAIDIGLVTVRNGEAPAAAGLDVVPVARTAVVLAVHRDVTAAEITAGEALEVFRGTRTTWRDGEAIVPLLRERGDSSTMAVAARLPGFEHAVEEARVAGRWPTLLTDAAMGRALAATPGAIGVFDFGAILLEGLDIRPLALDGLVPGAGTLADGRWPWTQTLALIVSRAASPGARAFVRFVCSESGRAVVGAGGAYHPVAESPAESPR